MSLGAAIDALGAFLLDAVEPTPALSGGVAPAAAAELPAITLSLSDTTRPIVGVGRTPRPPRTGALRVTTSLDLSDPVLRFPGEPDVPLLADGRTTLQLPHAPLVTSDGSPVAELDDDDLQVAVDASTFAVVNAPPQAGEVRPDGRTGILTFGAPLPPTGTLQMAYFIGQWDVRNERYRGVLNVDVYAGSSAAVETLSRSVDRALLAEPRGSVPGLRGIAPESWGSVVVATAPTSQTRVRTMRYRIDIEVEEVVIPTGGGVIARVRVVSGVDGTSETFDLTG